MEELYDDMFDIDLGGRPATFVVDASDADSEEYEIIVAFNRDNAQTFAVENSNPVAYAKTSEVPGITNASGLIVHYGYLLDENNQPILDESGDTIIAENEFTYKVVPPHNDAFGLTSMQLSLDTP